MGKGKFAYGTQYLAVTTTVLGASASYKSGWLQMFNFPLATSTTYPILFPHRYVYVSVIADQNSKAAGLYIQQSGDNGATVAFSESGVTYTAPNEYRAVFSVALPWIRIAYDNGTVAQAVFTLLAIAVDVLPQADYYSPTLKYSIADPTTPTQIAAVDANSNLHVLANGFPNQQILNITLSDPAGGAPDTAITFGQKVQTIQILNRSSLDMYYRLTAAAATYQTIFGGKSQSLPVAATTPGYLRSSKAGGGDIAEVIGLY